MANSSNKTAPLDMIMMLSLNGKQASTGYAVKRIERKANPRLSAMTTTKNNDPLLNAAKDVPNPQIIQ